MPPTLWGLSISPWTEKARWALDHHGVAYRYREHTPMLGEPALRWRTRGRAPGARATVPVLIDGAERLLESEAIAHYAERRDGAASLFPKEHRDAISSWTRASDEAMQAGRVLVTHGLLASRDAQLEMLPPQIPAPLRRLLAPMASAGASFFARKYAIKAEHVAESLRVITEFGERLRAQLDGREYLVGDGLSWADISAAMLISGFSGGVPGRLSKLPASAQTWTRAELVEQFGDLIAWRDQLYAKYRPRSARIR